jgi:hypothetical protein
MQKLANSLQYLVHAANRQERTAKAVEHREAQKALANRAWLRCDCAISLLSALVCTLLVVYYYGIYLYLCTGN